MNHPPIIGVMLLLLLAACTSVSQLQTGKQATPVPPNETSAPAGNSNPLAGNLDGAAFVDDNEEYAIRQLLPRDGIRPIYEPEFVASEDAGLSADELVMGVEINGDSRAYPVSILRVREMVNDTVGGTPVLVTW